MLHIIRPKFKNGSRMNVGSKKYFCPIDLCGTNKELSQVCPYCRHTLILFACVETNAAIRNMLNLIVF